MTAEEKVLAKIRGLLAKTEGNGCTAEEAESAFAMAQRLMAKHAIEEEALIASGHDVKREPIINHKVNLRARDEVKRQRVVIIAAIAKANNCKVVDATDAYDQVWIVGHESEAVFVEILSAAVLMQFATERTRGWKAYNEGWAQLSRFKWVTGFAWGYAERISERIAAEADDVAEESAAAGESASKEMVFVGRKALVEDWMGKNLATKKATSRPVYYDRGAGAAGAEAANRADLSGGRNNVGGSGSRMLS